MKLTPKRLSIYGVIRLIISFLDGATLGGTFQYGSRPLDGIAASWIVWYGHYEGVICRASLSFIDTCSGIIMLHPWRMIVLMLFMSVTRITVRMTMLQCAVSLSFLSFQIDREAV